MQVTITGREGERDMRYSTRTSFNTERVKKIPEYARHWPGCSPDY
jgi:hypothetical protein